MIWKKNKKKIIDVIILFHVIQKQIRWKRIEWISITSIEFFYSSIIITCIFHWIDWIDDFYEFYIYRKCNAMKPLSCIAYGKSVEANDFHFLYFILFFPMALQRKWNDKRQKKNNTLCMVEKKTKNLSVLQCRYMCL